jgi:hypothetical protein
MTSKRTPPPWLLRWVAPVVQWIALLSLVGFAVFNAITDHGIQMAINCIFLGFLFCALLVGKLIDRKIAKIDALFADLKAAEAKAIAAFEQFETAVKNGYIEVIPTTPGDDRPTTLH